ncbi:MAG TPA: hypothetical protein VFR37_17515 [Longimicrobium sp.]|nr:hypothetical protein [Longimicrobium sp.]
MHLPFKPLSFAEILDGAFVLYRRGFSALLGTALLTGAVSAAAGALPSGTMAGILALVVKLVVYAVAWIALTWQVSRLYTGQSAPVNGGLQAAGASLLPALGGWLIAFVLYGIPVLLAGRVVFRMGVRVGMEGGGAPGGVLLLVLPVLAYGALAVTALALAFAIVPAVVLEGAGPWPAVARSFRLAGEAFVRVGGLVLVAAALYILIALGLLRIGGWNDDPFAIASPTVQLLLAGVRALLLPFVVGAAVLTYYDLRVRTEGLDLQLAADGLAGERAPAPAGEADEADEALGPREEPIPLG